MSFTTLNVYHARTRCLVGYLHMQALPVGLEYLRLVYRPGAALARAPEPGEERLCVTDVKTVLNAKRKVIGVLVPTASHLCKNPMFELA